MEQERRIEPRLELLEARIDFHELRLNKSDELQDRLAKKTEECMHTNTEQEIEIQRNLANISAAMNVLTVAAKETSDTLKIIAQTAEESRTKWIRFESAWRTVAAVAVVISVLLGGAWTVGTFVISYTTEQSASNK